MPDIEDVCEQFKPLIRKYTYKFRHYPDAENVAWLCLVEAYRSYDPSTGVPFAGYAASRVHYGLWNGFRAERKRWAKECAVGDSAVWEWVVSNENVQDEVEGTLEFDRIRNLLEELPEKQRRAIELTVIGDNCVADVAREMNVSVQAVYQMRERGLRSLRKVV